MTGLDRHYDLHREETRKRPRPRRVALGKANFLQLLLFRMLAGVIGAFAARGSLRLNYRGLAETSFGDGRGPVFRVRVNSLRTFLRILRDPDLGGGESYMDEGWVLEEGDLGDFLKMVIRNTAHADRTLPGRALRSAWSLLFASRRNSPRRSRHNAARHYDLGNDLYRAFLDEGMNYSCAFFAEPDQSLRAAQLNKLRTTIERLQVPPGARVLDIGSGWGELTRMIAAETGAARVTGITLAENQLALARERAAAMPETRPEYRLADYRQHAADNPQAYDRIVSIGMFEHVGAPNMVDYFAATRRMLAPGGTTLVHSIMRRERSDTSSWIQRHIFPGGYIPTIADSLAAARAGGLEPVCEPFIHPSIHYAETLRRWRRNFNEAWPGLDRRRYDDRFRRMWNFYLAGSEAAFDENGMYVAQMLLKPAG